MAAMADAYNKTSAALGRGATAPRMYNKTRGSGLASERRQAGNPSDSMTTTDVYNKTSTPEALAESDDGCRRWHV